MGILQDKLSSYMDIRVHVRVHVFLFFLAFINGENKLSVHVYRSRQSQNTSLLHYCTECYFSNVTCGKYRVPFRTPDCYRIAPVTWARRWRSNTATAALKYSMYYPHNRKGEAETHWVKYIAPMTPPLVRMRVSARWEGGW